jgi:hypothetical protein
MLIVFFFTASAVAADVNVSVNVTIPAPAPPVYKMWTGLVAMGTAISMLAFVATAAISGSEFPEKFIKIAIIVVLITVFIGWVLAI